MLTRAGWIAMGLGVLLAAGCSKAPTPTINESMTHIMQPQAQTIWDIASRAFNDKGDGLVAAKIPPTDWIKLAKAGRQLRDRAKIVADASPNILVRSADERIMGEDSAHAGVRRTWDAASPKQIKAYIDADPTLFAQRARVLEQAGADLLKAAHSHDIATVYRVSSNMDEVCDGCHQKFWGTDDPPPFPH